MGIETVTVRKDEYEGLLMELEERRRLDRIQAKYREECVQSALNEIGEKLYCSYEDFMESIGEPMDNILGEIYREKLKDVYRTLTRFGVNIREG